MVRIVWKRGPQADISDEYEFNQYEPDIETEYVFQRISTFYTKDGGKTYDKKLCNFEIQIGKDTEDMKTIASIDNHNMSPFVDQSDALEHLIFTNSKKPNTFIDIKWNIFQTDENKVDLNVEKMRLEHRHSFSVQGIRYTADQVRDFMDERDELQIDKDNIEQNMTFILSAKLDLEVRYKDIKANREKMEKEIEEIKPTLKSVDDKLDTLIKKSNQQIVQTKLENELFVQKKHDMEKHITDLDHRHKNKL